MIRTAAWVFERISLMTGCKAPLTQDFITIGKVAYYGDKTFKVASMVLCYFAFPPQLPEERIKNVA